MPSRETASLILALGVSLVALGLLAWQRAERARREDDLSPEDLLYFGRQDLRRLFVSVVMFLLAAGITFGSRMDHRLNGRPNPWFLATWLAIFWLIIVLTSTALIDWVATRHYSRRLRREMVRKGLTILRDEMKVRTANRARKLEAGGENGQASS